MTTYRISTRVHEAALADGALAMVQRDRLRPVILNSAARDVIGLIRAHGALSIDGIVASQIESYAVEETQARSDAERVIAELVSEAILEPV